jgi:protein SFI1
MQRWQTSLAVRRKMEVDFLQQFNKRYVKLALKKWQTKLKQKRQTAWRQDMRQKMKLIKTKSEVRLLKDAWTKWRQLNLSHRADVYYQQSLSSRHFSKWKMKLFTLDNMDNVADEFARDVYSRTLEKSWIKWKHITSLRRDEHIMVQRIECRIIANAFDLWRMHL